MAEPTALLLTRPADEAVPCADPKGGDPQPMSVTHPPVDLCDLADRRTEEATSEPMVLVEEIIEAGELCRDAPAHDQAVTTFEAVLHAAVATTLRGSCANPGTISLVTAVRLRLCGSPAGACALGTTCADQRIDRGKGSQPSRTFGLQLAIPAGHWACTV